MAQHDFMLDVTLTPSRRISGVFAGAAVEAHAAGVRFFHETSLEQLPERADLVITGAAGYSARYDVLSDHQGHQRRSAYCEAGGTYPCSR
jgi:nickel-dependent lactate racemase